MGRNAPGLLYPGSAHWKLAVRLCGRLIADDGVTLGLKGRRLARAVGFEGEVTRRPNGHTRGTRAAQALCRVMRALEELKLARRDDKHIVAVNLPDIAAWLADELDKGDQTR